MLVTKPSSIAVSQQSIPEFLRESNPNLLKFLEYYYDWMSADGGALDLLQNEIEYFDTDTTTPYMLQLLTEQLLSFIPASSDANRKLISKNMKDFYKAKGTLPSYDFILNILFNESASIKWNTVDVFRPSVNATKREGQISVYSDNNAWNNTASGSVLRQTYPTEATLFIDSVTPTYVNGNIVNIIDINPESIFGDFVVGGVVEALDNTIDRSWIHIEDYYTLDSLVTTHEKNFLTTSTSYDCLLDKSYERYTGITGHVVYDINDDVVAATFYLNQTGDILTINGLEAGENYRIVAQIVPNLTVSVSEEVGRVYSDLIVREVNSDFRAVINELVLRTNFNNKWRLVFSLDNITGTLTTDDIYLISSSIENTHYTKGDYFMGIIAPQIVDIHMVNSGALYEIGELIKYKGGSGTQFDARVFDVGGGAVDTVKVVSNGYGYSVGDRLDVDNIAAYGSGLVVEVSNIDGIGSSVQPYLELEAFSITNAGKQYAVGDVITFTGGQYDKSENPATLTVSSVSTPLAVNSIDILSGGWGYTYANLRLLDTTTNTLVSGFAADVTIIDGAITQIDITQFPSLANSTIDLLINGDGATATATVSGGVVTLVTVNTGGFNYTNPYLQIVSAQNPWSQLQVEFVINGSGTITAINVIDGGSNYSGTIQLQILERWGLGAETNVVVNQSGSGPITGLTITEGGKYYDLPNCFDVDYFTDSVNGTGLTLDVKFKVKDVSIITAGENYRKPSLDSTVGIGRGAVVYPVFADGVVATVPMGNIGSGYTYATVSIIGTGVGFKGIANVSGGNVNSITIFDGGVGYSGGDSVVIYGDGINAAATLTVKNGVVRQVEVLDGGQDYAYDTTFTYVMNTTDYPTAVAGSFTPIIQDGQIKSIQIVDGGSGYEEVNNWLEQEIGDYLLMENGDNLEFDWTFDIPLITSGAQAVITLDVAGHGSVQSTHITNAGIGYLATSELTPLSVDVISSSGHGAVIVPVLELGQFVSLNILNAGTGYVLTDTISVTGGGGTSADLKPIFSNGKLVEVTILNAGSSYQYGTKAIIIGDGDGASLSVTVNTSITEIIPILGGSGYDDTVALNITDGTGTGAITKVNRDNNGAIVSVDIISGGSLYVNPQVAITGGGLGAGATLTAIVPRHIDSVDIISSGTGYSSATIFIYGDGTDAKAEVKLEDNGSLGNPQLVYSGSGYVSNPLFNVLDISGYGAVTAVEILNGGSQYTKPPVLSLADKYNISDELIATGATFYSHGDDVGHIKGVEFLSFGTSWEESPKFLFPMRCIMQENVNFVVGEAVTLENYPYTTVDTTYDVLTEDNFTLVMETKLAPLSQEDNSLLLTEGSLRLMEEGVFQINQEYYGIHDAGPSAVVENIDFSRRILELGDVTDSLNFVTEDEKYLVSENGLLISDEISNGIYIGDILVGSQSTASAAIAWTNRATGTAINGAIGLTKKRRTDRVGILNQNGSKLHDGKRIQDYSYTIKTGLSIDTYEKVITETVHPAGYKMYGDVVVSEYADGYPVEVPYSFGITGADSSFQTILNIKTGYGDLNALLNKNLWLYNGTKQYWYTTHGGKFADYTFNQYDKDHVSYLSDIEPISGYETYVSKSAKGENEIYPQGSSSLNSGIITGLPSTSYINIGYRILAWDVNGANIFKENLFLMEDGDKLLWEILVPLQSGNLITDEDMVTVTSITNSNTIVASKNAKASETVTVAVQNIPSLYLN